MTTTTDTPDTYVVEERTFVERATAVRKATLPPEQIPTFVGGSFSAVAAVAGEQGIAFAGPPFARYCPLEDRPGWLDVEVGFPVVVPIAASGDVVPSTLPGGRAAVTRQDSGRPIQPAFDALLAWIAEHGGHAEVVGWERFLVVPNEPPYVRRLPDPPYPHHSEVVQPFTAG